MDSVLEPLLDEFRQAAAGRPASRRGTNKCYAVADAASCALDSFFLQAPSLLEFQRLRQDESARCNCQSLCGVRQIACDNSIRNLLDGCQPELFAHLFRRCLEVPHEQGALAGCKRLDKRLLVALDGIQVLCSDKVHCPQCALRHGGQHRCQRYCHSMLAAEGPSSGLDPPVTARSG